MTMRRTFILSAFCSCLSLIVHHSAFAAGVDHSAFDAILKATVRDERVDYNAIKTNHLPALNAYLQTLASTDVAATPRDEQLALYINLYNATMIREVIARYAPGWTPAAQDFKVFKDPTVKLKTGTISLNDLENKVIRPTFKDPRIHVALVCAARSCPPLLPRAYTAETLNATLEENMTRFVNDSYRNPIDARSKQLRLSKIFEWYADDFGGKNNISAYVDKSHPANTAGWKISFVDYVWDLNNTR